MPGQDLLAPCAFRRVAQGQALCMLASDEFDRPVWAETCRRCPVPGWLAAGICTHLDVATEVARKLGVEPPVVRTACRFFNERMDGVERCKSCPEFKPWQGGQPEEGGPTATQQIAESIPREVLEQAVKEALDRRAEQETVRAMLRCFRLGVDRCFRVSEFAPGRVMVLPPPSLRGAESYISLIGEVLKQGQLEPIFFQGNFKDIDGVCDLCAIVQHCGHSVIDVGEWDPAALFALGLAGALGRSMLLIRQQDATPPFTPQGFPIAEYSNGEDLAMALVRGLQIQLPPQGAQGQQVPPGPQEGQVEAKQAKAIKGGGEEPPAPPEAPAEQAQAPKAGKRKAK